MGNMYPHPIVDGKYLQKVMLLEIVLHCSYPQIELRRPIGILKSMGGDISIASDPGYGTRVRILFPFSGESEES